MKRFSQSFAPQHLAEWDVSHDGKNVDYLSVSAQSECETLQQKNWAYVRNDHHDEDMGHNQSVLAQIYSLMNQNHMSDG
jgi:hypothetical protein